MFMERVKEDLDKDALSLEINPEKRDGLAVAFVVNGSRLAVDIKRDLDKGRVCTRS